MSVVPLILGKTVVKTKDEFHTAGGIQGDKILILHLDNSQLRPEVKDESNLTYDLRVGEEYRDHRYKGKADIGKGGIKLRANSAVIIQTLEHVHVPKFRFGYIVPKVSLLQQGISNTSSKVDPGYEGRLLITVFNLGRKTVTLRQGQKFCTVAFHAIMKEYPGDVRIYGKGEKRLEGATYTDLFRMLFYVVRRTSVPILVLALAFALVWYPKFADAIKRKTGAITLLLGVISVIVICLEAGLFHRIGEILKRLPPE